MAHSHIYAWKQRKLRDVVEIVGGGTPDTSNPEFWNGEIDWYSPTEIGEKIYANGSNKTITYLGLEKSSAKLLPAQKTILFTSRASIGDMAILIKAGATNQGFQSFIVNDEMDIYFLYSMGYKIKEFALKNASGSTFLEISKNELGKMDIFIPPTKAEQQAIGEFFRQLDDTIAFHQRELEKYQQLKQVLLDQLFV
ncbi:restriction endonuclease subunit S [Moraxella lacunata]|uniref:restriction endonuclease subunit S n=1 Tax=Moraxella lacunata TaxID=477 RepID=UPI000E0ECF88|nr:restriction endonuclease subunit S [Moraxella lacunata]